LILISFRLARARRAGAGPREAPVNPQGRPPGIPNPKRRVPDLVARPLGPKALSGLLDREPYLLRALAARIAPPVCRGQT